MVDGLSSVLALEKAKSICRNQSAERNVQNLELIPMPTTKQRTRQNWSPADTEIVIQGYQLFGQNVEAIRQLLPDPSSRTDIQLKNKLRNLKRANKI